MKSKVDIENDLSNAVYEFQVVKKKLLPRTVLNAREQALVDFAKSLDASEMEKWSSNIIDKFVEGYNIMTSRRI